MLLLWFSTAIAVAAAVVSGGCVFFAWRSSVRAREYATRCRKFAELDVEVADLRELYARVLAQSKRRAARDSMEQLRSAAAPTEPPSGMTSRQRKDWYLQNRLGVTDRTELRTMHSSPRRA